MDTVPRKSVFDFSELDINRRSPGTDWIFRLIVNEDGTGLSIHNEANESILCKEAILLNPLEFTKNKLLIPAGTDMYLI